MGPSGSGKTTLLNLIVGTVAPNAGSIFINGRDATDLPPGKRDIGMVFQHYALMPHMTIFRNISFPLEVRKVKPDEIRRRVAAVLDLIKLPEIGGRYPRELSGGQQQRVSLARCLVYNPSVILMDEPLGALDRRLREQMQLEIKRLHSELGVTMIYVTHDQEEALTLSDRIVLMNGGTIEQVATPDHLYLNPVSTFAAQFLGDSNLFDVDILEAGEWLTVKGALAIWRARNSLSCRSGPAALLVRPENVMLSENEDPPGGHNCVGGTVTDSIFVGGVVKYFLVLADGSRLLAQDVNRADRKRLQHGQKVLASWHPRHSMVLTRAPGGAQPAIY